ncbi:uncharacterized protein K02A2.6-like [Vanessa cardui]|uniref:uncharacterized protein K02A2.6-like n=1 Tax=Vanessa cardui TaxID=171605 RepID=UPI001F12E1E8|nr:uncharacterized protein K02A2.6-like [Vanessa cardui]
MFSNSKPFFGNITTFNHQHQDWVTYKSRLQQWFVANDIDGESDKGGLKRRAILLSAFDESTYQLASNLVFPKTLDAVSYVEIVRVLDVHFTPKRCGFAERHHFYAASQRPGESHAQWAARLRGLASHCSFKNLEEALLDKFVMGMLPGTEKEKLFAMEIGELSMAKAVDLAEGVRCARMATTAAGTAEGVSVDPLFKMTKGRTNRSDGDKCSVCGRKNHKSSECRFVNYRCKKCNNKGHLHRMCKKVNYVDSDEVNEGDDGEFFNIRSNNGGPMTETISINNILLKFQIDSGSSVTAISDKTYYSYFNSVTLIPTNKKLISYNGGLIQSLGIARLPVTYNNKTNVLDFYVIQNGGPPLLGRDFISKFNLELSPINGCYHVSSVPESELQSFLKKYSDIFTDELGCFNKYKIKLHLKENAKPVFMKARPVPFALRDKIDKEISRLLQIKVIEPVEFSEYASPIVPVLKHNGTVRLCADYSQTLNKQLLVEKYPLPTIQELFTRLHGGEQFSKLDMSSAYNQFELLDDKHVTCINTHKGLFKFKRLVFGLSSAPAIFQRAMESILSGIDGVLCFLDDILITGKDKVEHWARLKLVFDRLKDSGLTLRKEKCEFFKNEINYLGYIIDKNGIRKSSEKVKAILEAAVPKNLKELQSFLGLINYYRNFVPNASTHLAPLYDLLKKGAKWSWSPQHERAFLEVKTFLTSENVLAHFDSTAKIILTVDASPYGLGAVLSQVGADGLERPVSFASRTLNSAEKKYSQIQKEATAIIFGVRRFHQYLYARSEPFILRTDHKPLISIFGSHRGIPEVSANRLQRYAIFLSAYNYTIEYVKSANNSADFLSRGIRPATAAASTDGAASISPGGTREDAGSVRGWNETATYVNFILEGCLPVTLDQLKHETKNDPVLTQVSDYVLKGWPRKVYDCNLLPYFKCRLQLSLENGILMRGHKVVIPENLRKHILLELHKSHLGIVKTKAEARSRFWFPGIDEAIEKMIGDCSTCISMRQSPPRAPPAPWPYPTQPFNRIHIDFLGPIQNKMFFVIVDAYSKWVECFNMNNNITSGSVISKLCEFMSRFGVPQTIVSDNGTSFTSEEFNAFCKLNGICHLTSPAYHPSSNGQAETYVKIVKKGIKTALLLGENAQDMNNRLLKYLFDYRNSVHSTTGVSPAKLVFGRQLRSILDLLIPHPSPSSPRLNNHVQNKQCLQTKYHGGKLRTNFKPDDVVMFKSFINKNRYVWCKGTIIKQLGKVLYLIKTCEGINVKKHKNQIVLSRNVSKNQLVQPGNSNRSEEENQHRSDVKLASVPSTRTQTKMVLRNIPRVNYKKYF